MIDWLFRHRRRDRLVNWLGIDSWIDSSLAGSWQIIVDRWNAASSFFGRFRLAGWKRIANEILSEGLTLATGGFIVLYALALPAFLEIDESRWLSTGKYSVKFLDRYGNEIGKRGILHSDSVPLDEIPDYLIKSALATEDRRFFEHFGVDVLGTARALVENLRANDVVQGGSTLTQQLAKNLFLSSERSLKRKIKEAFLSLWIESRLTKREILKLYLDRAYMGGGAFGVEAAAQFYFGKSVRQVSLAEAAMMAGLFKAPTKYAPHIDLPAARARANEVLSNLVEAGFMTSGQVHEARLNPATPVETRTADSPDWFLDWAFEEVQRVAEGKGQYILTARTTIDLEMQKHAERALATTIRQHGKAEHATSGALVAMERDGGVRAIVGGLDYGDSQFNRATMARRQPGSSFKPYVYAVALENGYTPNSRVFDRSRSCGNWAPKNYSGGSGGGGAYTLAMALAKSLNTVAVDLSLGLGRDKVLDMMERLGIKGVKRSCSMALGDTGIPVIDHVSGYATFANDGRLARPYAVLELLNSRNEVVYSRERDEPEAPQVVAPGVAAQLNQMLAKVVQEGTGRRAELDFTYAVGKTGTSSSYRDAWFVGFTGRLVAGVWIGNDDFTATRGVTGGSLPATTWQAFMASAHPSMAIPQIPGLPLHERQVAEIRRLEELKKSNPAAAERLAAEASGKAQLNKLMPDRTRRALEKLAGMFEKAGAKSATVGNPSTSPQGIGTLPGKGRGDEPKPRTGSLGPGTTAPRLSRNTQPRAVAR